MRYYVGLDVSLKTTQICVVDEERRVVWRGSSDTQPGMIIERLERLDLPLTLVGLETGSLTPWLYHLLKQGIAGLIDIVGRAERVGYFQIQTKRKGLALTLRSKDARTQANGDRVLAGKGSTRLRPRA